MISGLYQCPHCMWKNLLSQWHHHRDREEVKGWNEVDNRTGLEYEGFQRSLNLVKSKGCKIATFVSDRHGSITKHMREKEEQTNHYFDLWHLKKSIYCIYILYYMTVIHNIWSKHSTLFFLHYTKFHNNLLANRYQYHTCDHFGMKWCFVYTNEALFSKFYCSFANCCIAVLLHYTDHLSCYIMNAICTSNYYDLYYRNLKDSYKSCKRTWLWRDICLDSAMCQPSTLECCHNPWWQWQADLGQVQIIFITCGR